MPNGNRGLYNPAGVGGNPIMAASDQLTRNIQTLGTMEQDKQDRASKAEAQQKSARLEGYANILPYQSDEAKLQTLQKMSAEMGIEFDPSKLNEAVEVMKKVNKTKDPQAAYDLLQSELPNIALPEWLDKKARAQEAGLKKETDHIKARKVAVAIGKIRGLKDENYTAYKAAVNDFRAEYPMEAEKYFAKEAAPEAPKMPTGKWTPESMQKYTETGDYRALEREDERMAVGAIPTDRKAPTLPVGVPEEAARAGTGPYASLAAATDAILGGILPGRQAIFPDTQESRQALRIIRQKGKTALMNSSRGPVWEQQRIDELFPNPDKFWTNPETEAQKISTLRGIFRDEFEENNRMLESGTLSKKESNSISKNNQELMKVLNMIGMEEADAQQPVAVINRPAGKTDEQLLDDARAALKAGAPINLVNERLQGWGLSLK